MVFNPAGVNPQLQKPLPPAVIAILAGEASGQCGAALSFSPTKSDREI
jgi:hypothetical protein